MTSFQLEYAGDNQSQTFDFEGDSITIGRDKSSDFVLDHPTVSRQHAVIVNQGEGFELVVLSRGGLTAVDGEPIEANVPLYDGATLYFGKLKFRFRSPHAPPSKAGRSGAGAPSERADRQSGGQGGRPGQAQAGTGARSSGGFDAVGRSADQSGGGAASGSGAGPSGGVEQPARQARQSGGFDQSTRETSQSGGFGQAGGGDTGGFQQHTGGFEQPGGGVGRDEFGPQTGGFEQSSAASQSTAGGQAEGAGQQAAAENGIKSWDEIAGESESSSEDAQRQAQAGPRTLSEQISSKNEEEEKTNPVLVAVAAVAIAGLSWFILADDGPTGGNEGGDKPAVEEQEPLVVNVDCMGESDCLKEAEKAYKVGDEKLEQKDAAVTNLFEGYKKFEQSLAYLDKAGVDEPPEDLKDLESRRDEAREELDGLFRNYHVMYHRASKSNNYEEMAKALREIEAHFPDTTAREHKWADEKTRELKRKDDLPDTINLPD